MASYKINKVMENFEGVSNQYPVVGDLFNRAASSSEFCVL